MKSTKFAFIILIILIAFLAYVSYIKFTYVEEKEPNNTTETNNTSLSTIANNYNSNSVINKITNQQIQTTATVNEDKLIINYNNNNYEYNFTNGILENTTTIKENSETQILSDIAICLLDAIYTSKNNTIGMSILTGIMVVEQEITNESFSFNIQDNIITTKIDTTKEITLYNSSITYDKLTILDIGTKDYSLNMLNTIINVISNTYNEEEKLANISIYVEPIEQNNKTIIFKLYDDTQKEVKRVEQKISEMTTNKIDLTIELEDQDQSKISSYSIDIKESD